MNYLDRNWMVFNSHIKGGKMIAHPRVDEGVDILAEVPPFIGNDGVATLIGLAPEFLKCLQEVAARFNPYDTQSTETLKKARALILAVKESQP